MIDSSFDKLKKEFAIKSKVIMWIVRLKYPGLSPFETFRTRARQVWLYANRKKGPVAKPWTSMHEKGLAIDRVFLNKKGQPTWIGDYKYLHLVGGMCWVLPVAWESCHLQDNWKTISATMLNNSKRREKETAANKKLLKSVNDSFRTFWYK